MPIDAARRRPSRLVLALLATTSLGMCLLRAGNAHAQETQRSTPPAPPPAETYTLQILAADGISLAVFGIGGAIEGSGHGEGADTLGNVLMYGGLGGLWLGGPIVHTAHGHWGLGLASLALRVALPVAGAAIGGAAADCTKDEWLCGLGEAVLGYTIGTAAAITIDAAVLARWSAFGRSDPSSAAITPPSRPRAVALAPRLVATPNFTLVGVGGTF